MTRPTKPLREQLKDKTLALGWDESMEALMLSGINNMSDFEVARSLRDLNKVNTELPRILEGIDHLIDQVGANKPRPSGRGRSDKKL